MDTHEALNAPGPYTVSNVRSGLMTVASLDRALKLVANADDPNGRVFDATGATVATDSDDACRKWRALRARAR